jgi:hypothetical protein
MVISISNIKLAHEPGGFLKPNIKLFAESLEFCQVKELLSIE